MKVLRVREQLEKKAKITQETMKGTLRYFAKDPQSYDEGVILAFIDLFKDDVLEIVEQYQREITETMEIMKDTELMEKIREARKKGSRSSPYEPLSTDSPSEKELSPSTEDSSESPEGEMQKLLHDYPIHTIQFYENYPLEVKKEYDEWKKRLELLTKKGGE